MNIVIVFTELLKLVCAKCIFANETGGSISVIYKFSDPDGVRSGKSGWSFGIVQYDILNNPNAIFALREMGFTTDEILGLKAQTISDMSTMDAKLIANKDIVDEWDRKQVDECITWPLSLCNEVGAFFSSEYSFLHIADYHNQYGMSRGGKMHSWIKSRSGTEITPEMIRDFKYTTLYGKAQLAKNDPSEDDVLRRYNNIVRISAKQEVTQ